MGRSGGPLTDGARAKSKNRAGSGACKFRTFAFRQLRRRLRSILKFLDAFDGQSVGIELALVFLDSRS